MNTEEKKNVSELKTPAGYPVLLPNDAIASKVQEELQQGAAYDDVTHFLCYIYTYSDIVGQGLVDEIKAEYKAYWEEAVFEDDFLMIRQTSPVAQAIGSYYSKDIQEWFDGLNPLQLAAAMCVVANQESIMLAYHFALRAEDILADNPAVREELSDYLAEHFELDRSNAHQLLRLNKVLDHLCIMAKVFAECWLA